MSLNTATLPASAILDILHAGWQAQSTGGFTASWMVHGRPGVGKSQGVQQLADRIGVLYAFEFVEVGTTPELVHDPRHPYTRALLNATPNLDAPLSEMEPIDGTSPDPVNVPPGCSYHERCPMATQQCRDDPPRTDDASDTHDVACHHWRDVDDEIALWTEANR